MNFIRGPEATYIVLGLYDLIGNYDYNLTSELRPEICGFFETISLGKICSTLQYAVCWRSHITPLKGQNVIIRDADKRS